MMFKNKRRSPVKRLLSAASALSVMLLGGGLQALPAGVSLTVPAITAKAATGSVTLSEDGVLTLSGELTKEQIWEYRNDWHV